MKNNTTQELGNKKLLSWSKAWRLTQILKTKKQCQQLYISIQYVNQSINQSIRITILIIFRFVTRQMVSPKKVHVQTTWNFKLQNCTSRNQTHITEVVKDTCVTTEWYPFVISLARCGCLFLIYIWGWVERFFYFLMVGWAINFLA
jgi:hypothetical protein